MTAADQIDALLSEMMAILAEHGEERWAMAFGRVHEHVAIGRSSPDPLSVPRLVRDLMHMFRGGMGAFGELELTLDDRPAREATEQLHALREELNTVVRQALRPGVG
jgi:hypothetical protein